MLHSKFGPEANKRYGLTQELLNTPQIQAQKSSITELEWKKNKLNEDIFKLDTDVRNVLGSEAPESLISAYIWERTKDISGRIRTIDNELSVQQGKLQNYLTEVNSTLDYIKTGYAEDMKKKWSGTWASWGESGTGIEALYNDRTNGSVAWGELFNDATLKRYGLKGKSRGQIIQAISEIGWGTSDIGWLLTKVGELTPQYWDELASTLPSKIVNKQGAKYVKYLKENSDNWKSDVATALKWTSKEQATKILDDAGIKWFFSGRRKILNSLK